MSPRSRCTILFFVLLPDRIDFARGRRRGAWLFAIDSEKGNRVDVQDVLVVASHRRNWFRRRFLGRIPTIIGVAFLAIYAFKEFARASGLYRDSWMTGAVYAGIVTVGIATLISDPRGRRSRRRLVRIHLSPCRRSRSR